MLTITVSWRGEHANHYSINGGEHANHYSINGGEHANHYSIMIGVCFLIVCLFIADVKSDH